MLPSLSATNVSKRYGTLLALDRVSVSFLPGEIHAVLGENGAGKSTLMGVLSGFTAPTEGEVALDGRPIPLGEAFACKQLGIEMIHQHFTLAPEFTVAENLALARLPGLVRSADPLRVASRALDVAKDLGWEIDPKARVRDLSVGVRQRLEILKALSGEAKVLIFDEPTAVLAPDEVADLFRVLRQLRDEGRIVVLIAHKLSEIAAVADRVTVLRRGKWIATVPLSETNTEELARWMVGEMPPRAVLPDSGALRDGLSVEGLVVRGDRGETAVRGVSFEARRGEIFGVGGVDGNGQVELAEALAGVRPPGAGTIRFAGERNVGYVPQDRQADALALTMTIEDNLLVTGHRRADLSRGPFLRPKAARDWAEGLIERFAIKASGPDEYVGSLSGGNQQKVVVSRTFDAAPNLLVVVNPTRGLDVKASAFVHERLREARAGGAAVVLFSTDLDELYALADRAVFMSRGELREDRGAASLVGGAPE